MEHEDDVEFDTTPPDCFDEYEDTTEGHGLNPAASIPAPPSSCHGGTMKYACCAKDLCRRAEIPLILTILKHTCLECGKGVHDKCAISLNDEQIPSALPMQLLSKQAFSRSNRDGRLEVCICYQAKDGDTYGFEDCSSYSKNN